MKFAKYTFLVAGILGLLALLPQYFLLEKNGIDFRPPINHPEYYFGFIGVAIAFQIVFLIVSSDPMKYRLIILAAIVEKFSFGIPCIILFMQGKLAGPMFAAGMLDTILGILFVVSWFTTGKTDVELVNEYEN